MSTLADPEVLVQLGSLLGMACFCVWTGSKRSHDEKDTETITTEEAIQFPLFASGALLFLYLLFRYVNSEWLTILITAYFAFVGTTGVQFAISPTVTRLLSPYIKRVGDTVVVAYKDGEGEQVTIIEFTRGDVVSTVLGGLVSALYVYTHHWITTNIIAMGIVISAIQIVKIDSFKVACILLSGLFVYDIFWVFGTDVMVTVAKSVDGPIKILFPLDIVTGGVFSTKLGMLGLGDIMIPGVVVAMLYRFDLKRGGGLGAQTPYFNAAFTAYALGLVLTFIILHVSKHAQPALLYLSPIGILTPLGQAWLRGDVKELFEYGEDAATNSESKAEKKTSTSKDE